MTESPLPDRYLITPFAPPGGIADFAERGRRALAGGIRLWRLRPGPLPATDLEQFVAVARRLSDEYGARLLVGAEAWPAGGADGLHLDRGALRRWRCRPAGCRLLAASCHDLAEIELAVRIGADFVVCSPVLPTPSHPGGAPLGWDGFERLARVAPMPVYALGGMGPDHLPEVRRRGGRGIAAIRALWPAGTRGRSGRG